MDANSSLAIEFCDVTKDYPGTQALKGISFGVKKGRVHGFLGPNGAGKSTAMNILAGLIPPSSGDVIVRGKSVKENPFAAREQIGFLPENPPLYDNMRVRPYLEFVAEIHALKSQEKKNLKQQVQVAIEKCHLEKVEGKLLGNLSKGFRQRVGIAQAIVFDPEIIIFDEPTNGLDPDAIVEIRNLTRELGKERTVLFSSHILSEVELMCDDITIIRDGKIAKTGTLEEVQNSYEIGKVINAQLLKWTSEVQSKLSSHFDIQALEVKEIKLEGDSTHLEIKMGQAFDRQKKAELSKFFIEHDCGLLFFEERKPHLEDIFHLTASQKEHN